MNAGIVGGIIGIILGCCGGLFGAYCSYKAANGRRERQFVIWSCLFLVAFLASFLVALHFFPEGKIWLWTLYPLMLVFAIRLVNRKQTEIRQAEHTKG